MEPANQDRVIPQINNCHECALTYRVTAVGRRSDQHPNKLKVSGTATDVGFHCNDCGTKWTAYELTRRKVKLLGELDGDNI